MPLVWKTTFNVDVYKCDVCGHEEEFEHAIDNPDPWGVGGEPSDCMSCSEQEDPQPKTEAPKKPKSYGGLIRQQFDELCQSQQVVPREVPIGTVISLLCDSVGAVIAEAVDDAAKQDSHRETSSTSSSS